MAESDDGISKYSLVQDSFPVTVIQMLMWSKLSEE